MKRILLSVPHMGGNEETYVRQAFATNWLSTVGPNLTAFERNSPPLVGAKEFLPQDAGLGQDGT